MSLYFDNDVSSVNKFTESLSTIQQPRTEQVSAPEINILSDENLKLLTQGNPTETNASDLDTIKILLNELVQNKKTLIDQTPKPDHENQADNTPLSIMEKLNQIVFLLINVSSKIDELDKKINLTTSQGN